MRQEISGILPFRRAIFHKLFKGYKIMEIKFLNATGLFGYIIVINEEIHSRQIKWLYAILDRYELVDGKDLIQDILDDKDEKAPYNDCIMSFQQESKATKDFIYRVCYQLAIIDDDNITSNKPDSQEDRVLKDMESYMDSSDAIFQRRQAIRSIDKSFLSGDEVKPFELDFDSLLRVASDDYDAYQTVFNNIFSECRKLSGRLEVKLQTIKSPLLKSALESFLSEYRENVASTLSDLKAESAKKELAAHNFSIALMGRTKAGKSTLHYVMCEEGSEFIGKGSQRTTRFNRVFSWRKLKIIDTPGIGAGEEDGKKDEAIALRVLSQADIICFVLIDDTIQDDVLGLLDRIAEYHKPMLIVLNHKENIRRKSHFNTFCEKMDEWMLTEGESNLKGYINRLNRNAAKHNYDKLMRVVPVFLLASQIGIEHDNTDIYNASNYPAFIEEIRELVSNNSLIYKSKTMLDEPSIRLHKAYATLSVEGQKLLALQEKVHGIRERTFSSIDSSRKFILFESKRSIRREYDDFYTAKHYEYVEANYKEKNAFALSKAFEKLISEHNLKGHISDILSDYLVSYHGKITELVGEIDEELNYAKLNVNNLFGTNTVSIKGASNTSSFRGIFKAVSMLLDVASIAYPVLAIASIPVSLLGNLFKSKETKVKKAKKLMSDNFSKLTDFSREQTAKNAERMLEKIFKEDRRAIAEFFDALEENLAEVMDFISSCRNEFDSGIKRIDTRLADRILQYVSAEPQELSVVRAERDSGSNEFTIYVKQPAHAVETDISKYQKISTEKLNIQYVEQ